MFGLFLLYLLPKSDLTKRMKKLLYFIAPIILASACGSQGVTERLNEIDTLIDKEQIDSACVILHELDNVSMTAEDQARYYLLYIQLGFLTQHPDSTNLLDSLVIPYYLQKNDQKNLANAYYYKGYDLVSKGNYAKATYYYKKAEEQAMGVDDDKLLYKVYESLSAINNLTGNYKLELDYAKKALIIIQRVNNNKWTYYALYNMALAFSRNKQKDSSLYYINKMEPFLKYVPKYDLANTFTSIAYLYKHTNPEKAKYYLEKSLSEAESSYALAHLSDIYVNEGKIDEAYLLWKKALTINDDNPKDIILHNLLEYDMEHGRTDSVCQYVNKIIVIKDSIINSLRNDTIKDLQLRFDHEVAMHKQETITNNWQKWLLFTILLVTLLVALIIIKRYRDKNRMQEAQMQIIDLMNQIRTLEAAGEKDSEAVRLLNEQVSEAMNQDAASLQQGKQLYDHVMNGGTVSTWRKKEFELFIDYYTAIDYKTVSNLKKTKRKEKLTIHNLFFLLLKEMGYEKKEIARILGIGETSVNTLNTRTKPIE